MRRELGLTGDERRVVGDEERHQPRDVLRLPEASQRAVHLNAQRRTGNIYGSE